MSAAIQVFLVEDDQQLSLSLQRSLIREGHKVLCYATAESLLLTLQTRPELKTNNTVVLMDVNLSGQSGVAAQQSARAIGLKLPFVFISAQQDAQNVNQAWRDGASDFLFKPFTLEELLRAITSACHLAGNAPREVDPEIQAKLQQLTDRQKQVLVMVAKGQTNFQMAEVMNISPRTVKMHRAAVMHRLGFAHVSDLIRFHDACKTLL